MPFASSPASRRADALALLDALDRIAADLRKLVQAPVMDTVETCQPLVFPPEPDPAARAAALKQLAAEVMQTLLSPAAEAGPAAPAPSPCDGQA